MSVQEKILHINRTCNPTEGRVDYHLESRAVQFGVTKSELVSILAGMRSRAVGVSFDHGWGVVIVKSKRS
jgi:hypothetical protein